VQKEVLDKNRALPIDVYVIWFSMLPGDSRASFPMARQLMPDHRVIHFWDPNKVAGRWFKENITPDYRGKIIWDAYYLYGSEAEWRKIPEPVISWGRTIMDKRQELLSQIRTLAARQMSSQ
jgi:hypothetical protein